MKWQNLGQILEFDKSPFKDRFVSHAQSPQALVLKDRVRVYFSTRETDQPGQFLSHVQYVDYDHDFKKVIGHSTHQVISTGKLGCFDEHGIFPLSPTLAGDKLLGYTNGISRRISVAVETAIGYVVSEDNGRTFKRIGDGPIMGPTVSEPFLVGDPFVRLIGETFHMFYLYGAKWSEESNGSSERVYKIGHAISNDGLSWDRLEGRVIPDLIGENECQALPTFIKIGNMYHMYFCYRHMTGFRDQKDKGYHLGYAYSKDLISWTRDDKMSGLVPSTNGWDSDMQCYPNIFECNGQIYLLYNGNNFGKYGFGIAKLISEKHV